MIFQPKPQYLPTDLRSYAAPESWYRRNRDKVVGVGCAALFVFYLATGAGQTVTTTGEARETGLIDNVAMHVVPLRDLSTSAPTINAMPCKLRSEGQWLRLSICQQGDLTLAGCHCIYGHAPSARFQQ